MKRAPDSHKGENGKCAVIGGSLHMHGAPILSILAAERTGVDLLYGMLPRCHADALKKHCLNAITHPFKGDECLECDVAPILEVLATMDSALIGPGISRTPECIAAMQAIVAESM